MRMIWKLIKRGWHFLAEAHTAHWFYGLLPGLPATIISAGAWFVGSPWPIIVAIGIMIFASLFVALLAFLGYRRERVNNADVVTPTFRSGTEASCKVGTEPPKPDIDARDAFFQIIEMSEWRQQTNKKHCRL
jgi:hypothetical protein